MVPGRDSYRSFGTVRDVEDSWDGSPDGHTPPVFSFCWVPLTEEGGRPFVEPVVDRLSSTTSSTVVSVRLSSTHVTDRPSGTVSGSNGGGMDTSFGPVVVKFRDGRKDPSRVGVICPAQN